MNEKVELPDALNGFTTAASEAFGAGIIAIKPTSAKFGVFNGINVGGKNYVNIDSPVDFINITEREL